MAVKMATFGSRQQWLEGRGERIGGSEAASIVGLNPWQTNVDLWRVKTGRAKASDLSDNKFVKYGQDAERHLRALFQLDFPEYECYYIENNLWVNDKYPFAHASLDGWLTDENGRVGVLEIKTSNIVNPTMRLKWDGRIPDNYYCQVCWYMGVLEADFAIVKAQLKWANGEDVFLQTKHFKVEREDCEADIAYILGKGREFAEYVKRDVEPPLVLPDI